MTRRAWVRLDNASNIFLAARSDADPKVFRMSAEMDEVVDPRVLQEALDATYDRYPLYHAVLRSGVFWYYLQDSDLRPEVVAEQQHTCAPIYQPDRRNLLFRIMHHRRRIVLEIFHALSDGTGALWFLTDLVSAYVRLRHPEADPATTESARADAVGPGPDGNDTGAEPPDGSTEAAEADTAAHGFTLDSFAHYFRGRRRRRRDVSGRETGFDRETSPTALRVDDVDRPPPAGTQNTSRPDRPHRQRVHRVVGTRTPDHRTRAVELTMPASDVIGLARAEGASPTTYLTALFFESIRRSSGGLGRSRTMSASIPVNLRQFFPSTSPRNFFATIRVDHTFGEGSDDLASISADLEEQFRPQATPEALEQKLRRFIRLERMPVARAVPRPLKDLILRLINRGNNRGLTVAVSNLGRVKLPEPAESHVRRMLFHVSAARPQFCTMSHAGLMTISFTSPFTQTDHVREFARELTARGVDVTVAATRVTEEELAEADRAAEAAG